MRNVLLWALWGVLFVPNLIAVGLAYPVAPLVAGYAFFTRPVLPSWLRVWSTMDADLNGGIAQGAPGFKSGLKGWALWYQYVRWIWRNPSNGWQTMVYGFKAESAVVTLKANPKFLGRTWKVWLGWSDHSQDGVYRHYLFQCRPE